MKNYTNNKRWEALKPSSNEMSKQQSLKTISFKCCKTSTIVNTYAIEIFRSYSYISKMKELISGRKCSFKCNA